MEQIDREKAQRVWQRVQSRQPAAQTAHASSLSPTPEGFVLEELTDGEVLLQLARQSKEPANGPLRQLAAQTQSRAGILRGICRLAGLTAPDQLPKPGRQDNVPAVLRRLMGRLLRRLQEYRKLCDHPEFGPLYEGLAQSSRDSALSLAQVIGK